MAYKSKAGTNTEMMWDDLQVNVGRVQFPGSSDPTWTSYDHGVGSGINFTVLGFSVGDYIDFDIQTTHAMLLNSILDSHIHFILPNTTDIGDKFKFQLDVIVAGVNGTFAVPTGSPFTAEHTVAADDDSKHRLLGLGDIPASNTTVSSLYTCRLTRIAASADEYASDVYIKYIDSHYQKDSIGSKTEYTK